MSREAAVLLRRHLDFQRLLVATEAAAGLHRELLGRLERGVDKDGERRCQLELNRLLVVRACVCVCVYVCMHDGLTIRFDRSKSSIYPQIIKLSIQPNHPTNDTNSSPAPSASS